jgi:hypothetical protein
VLSSQPVRAQVPGVGTPDPSSTFKITNNPGGGQIMYGPLPGESTMQGAMGAMLRATHRYLGARPQIRQFFQAKGTSSVATFFTAAATRQGGGTVPVSGLVIVSMSAGSKPIGAVMFDDSAHFARTQPAMLATLNAAWQTASAAAPASGAAAARPAASVTLHQSSGGDQSASLGIPAGWQVTSVGGGQIMASGPNGEQISLGGIFQNIRDPRVPSSPYAPPVSARQLVAANNGDLFTAWVSVVNQTRQSRGLPPATFTLTSSTPLKPNPYQSSAVQVIFTVDLKDGKGLRKGSASLGSLTRPGAQLWGLSVSTSNLPATVADAEAPLMTAILGTYTQDAAVIGHENQVVLDRIKAIGVATNQRIHDQQVASQAQNQAFEQHMDDIDRSSKAMQNYTFDRSQLQVAGDDGNTYRGTVSNNAATALTQYDPNKYQVVGQANWIKGIDY